MELGHFKLHLNIRTHLYHHNRSVLHFLAELVGLKVRPVKRKISGFKCGTPQDNCEGV